MDVSTRRLAKQLRLLPKTELEFYCNECGMTDREVSAVIDYLYNMVKIDDLSARLGMSRATFIRHEKVLAVRLMRYLVANGKIVEIEDGSEQVSMYFKK